MFRPLVRSYRLAPRRGTSFILIVVAMVALFAAVGTAYALFALREAKLALLRKDAMGAAGSSQLTPPDPTATINRFLGTLLFDADYNDVTNGLRGHSLARSMYGYDALNPFNTIPWNGVGVFHEANPYGDRARQVNYTLVRIGGNPGNPVLLDPEYTGQRGFDNNGNPLPFDPTSRIYIGKNAGYSYPDMKDFFAAQVDAATGRVLVPSFYRAWQFGSLNPTNNPNDPNFNPNWTNPNGRLLTLRPRPAEHPQFPRVPANADGTFTGDVKNLVGAPGGNDSLWIDIGAPVIKLANGKRIKPLVAPLIFPLNGLFNGSVHGNLYGTEGTHVSYSGFGPWEVNIGPLVALETERQQLISLRGLPQQRNGLLTSRAFDPYTAGRPIPNSAPVAWQPANNASIAYPSGNNITGLPTFVSMQFDNSALPNHPSLFNANEWPGTVPSGWGNNPRVYPLPDIKRFHAGYALTPDWYAQAEMATRAPTTLKGVMPFTVATEQTTALGYRLDPAHGRRGLLTSLSFDLDRPKLTPSFLQGTLILRNNERKPHPATVGEYPAPQAIDPNTSDFAGPARWTNIRAALGAIDLNRPLTDYRNPNSLNAPLTPNNLGNVVQADNDRRKFAHDIFLRLAVATGAAITINPQATEYPQYQYALPPNITPEQFNALRYLAQLAVNIVDYIDNDDIATMFVWNPVNGNPNDAANFEPANIGNHVVFGVEKPRLVINEVYSEITNDPADPVEEPDGMGGKRPLRADARAHVRFWAELLNPTSNMGPNSPLGTGGVPLSAYRLEIARATRGADDLASFLNNHANVTGGFAMGLLPDIAYNLPDLPAGGLVQPNNGVYDPLGNPANGVVLLGPTVTNPKPSEFQPNTMLPPWQNMILAPAPPAAPPAGPSNGMAYTMPMPAVAQLSSPELKRHVVLLRRRANPYLPEGPTNPYITVDKMDFVPAFDAVTRAANQSEPRAARAMMNADGYDPIGERFAIGKVQPYAGLSVATVTPGAGNYNQYSFPASMVLPQRVPHANEPNHTLGRHNGVALGGPPVASYVATPAPQLANGETLKTPFDWFVHLDRPLVNPLELLDVRDSKPHMVTTEFVQVNPNPGSQPLTYDAGLVRWYGPLPGDPQPTVMFRALEMLSVKSHIAGVPHGGRVPGRINLNAVTDKRILQGLFDPQPGNNFDQAHYLTPQVWQQWFASRSGVQTVNLPDGTPVEVAAPAGPSVYDDAAGSSRPFLSFGVPLAGPNGMAFRTGSNIEHTIFRHPSGNNAGPRPLLFAHRNSKGPGGTNYSAAQPDGPLHAQAEPVRKIINNITTVNHQYVVLVTIGYFDVVADTLANGEPGPQLGAEAFINVPGDMRQKFIAVVDMTKMALDATANTAATVTPFFTCLEATTRLTPNGIGTLQMDFAGYDPTPPNPTLYIASDGQLVPIRAGTPLVLGYGSEQQVVTVTSVDGPGLVTVAGLTHTAWAGTCVSNVRPGYPGPQPGFRFDDPKYKPVVPYIERLR
ncbi:MAG: hypothetical protein RMJ56_13095 [Gemmataceae bacterium]|nr:hypothetical protein [Gemmata sp.]MDW8198532.1 hypothetical protein [Gemmataceae bacterium]